MTDPYSPSGGMPPRPADPYYPPMATGAPNPTGYPGTPGMPPPGAMPPGGGYPGYPPAAPPKRSLTWLWISLAAVLLLVAALVVTGVFVFLKPRADQRPATLTTPDTVAGFTKATDADLQSTANTLTTQLKAEISNEVDAVAAFYQDPAAEDKLLLFAGVTGDVDNPDKELDDTFSGLGSEVNVQDVHTVDPGPLGGLAKCGSGETEGVTIVTCAWADYGSLGILFFYNRPLAESEALFSQFRGEVLTRG